MRALIFFGLCLKPALSSFLTGAQGTKTLRRILDELLKVGTGRTHDRHSHGNVAYSDGYVFLRVGVELAQDCAARIDDRRAAETGHVAFLEECTPGFGGEDVLELVERCRACIPWLVVARLRTTG